MLQLNVDAALFAASGRSGAAVVVRECTDEFVASIGDDSPDVSNRKLAEALAIRLALSWAKDEGLDGFVVASDCLSIVQRIKFKERDRSLCASVVLDIKKLACHFSNCSFRHVGRLQNSVAHSLA
jgi:ribonuclease HI